MEFQLANESIIELFKVLIINNIDKIQCINTNYFKYAYNISNYSNNISYKRNYNDLTIFKKDEKILSNYLANELFNIISNIEYFNENVFFRCVMVNKYEIDRKNIIDSTNIVSNNVFNKYYYTINKHECIFDYLLVYGFNDNIQTITLTKEQYYQIIELFEQHKKLYIDKELHKLCDQYKINKIIK